MVDTADTDHKSAVDELLEYVQQQSGAPSVPGLRSWSDLVEELRKIPAVELDETLKEVEATFHVDITGENYEGWSEAKRRLANRDAAAALAEANRLEEAPFELRLRMFGYTGFGGMGDVGILDVPYPPEYVEASRLWAESKRSARMVPIEAATIMERVRDQFFTPLPVARAAWSLINRIAPNPRRVLEPSAGIGRFVRSAPSGLEWTLCELDLLMSDMLGFCFPEGEVHQGPFENYVRGAGANDTFDLVVGNPPYGARPPEMMGLDMAKITNAVDYFTIRGIQKLAPGGTLCFVVPIAFLIGPARKTLRTRLLRDAAFRGAAVFPSKTFPNVREGTFIVMLWTKRAATIAEADLDARERDIAAGNYLSMQEGELAICGGEWRTSSRGESFLYGAADYSKVAGVWLSPAPTGTVVVRGAQGAPQPVPVDVDEQTSNNTATLDDVLRNYLGLVNTDPVAAENKRMAVRQLVIDYLGTHGNPHPKGPAMIRAVVTKTGALEPVLQDQVVGVLSAEQSPPEEFTFDQRVEWWSERRGYALPADLGMTDQEAIDVGSQSSDVMLELSADGVLLYIKWTYFTGPPSARLKVIDNAMASPVLDPTLRHKLEAQKGAILQQWASAKTLGEIDVTPRSPFVPLEVLQDWVNEAVLMDYSSGRKSNTLPDAITLLVSDGLMSVAADDPGLKVAATRHGVNLDPMQWLIAYYNRSTMVDSTDGDGTQSRVYGKGDARNAAAIDQQWVERFQDWLGESKWVTAVEGEYNTKFAPPLLSMIPTTPVELPGISPLVKLHPHQNQAVRRSNLGGNAVSQLIAYDVGAGKTFVGIATAMRWRQSGACCRVIITCPTSVLAKWYADARRMFPAARIGLIGITAGKQSSDDQNVRLEKWHRFGSGGYDFLIVGHTAFFQDLEPSVQTVGDIVGNMLWARRSMGKELAKLRRVQLKLEQAEKDHKLISAVVDYSQYKRLFPRADWGKWENQRRSKLKELENSIAAMKAELSMEAEALGTDTQNATVQQKLRALIETKPYRPSSFVFVEGADVADNEDDENNSGDDSKDESNNEDESEDESGPKVVRVAIPGLVSWEDLGVDGLIVDEAHKFKNLWFPANKIEYAGKGTDELFGKKTPWDMLIKANTVHRKHGGAGGVMFLTATPMTNSPLELYSLLCMVAPFAMEDAGIYDKEAFIDRYWDVQPIDVPRPKGTLEPAPALVGFKNLDELNALIASVFDRKSTADLVAAGWLAQQPTATPRTMYFDRDPAQVALIRSLIAIFAAWTETKEEAKKREEGGRENNDALALAPRTIWSVNAAGDMIQGREMIRDEAPEVISDPETGRKARGILRLVWMSLLDKVAIDPRLLVRYAVELGARWKKLREKKEALDAWMDAKSRGVPVSKKPPRGPSPTQYVTIELAVAVCQELSLEGIVAYYASRPFVPKILAVAEWIKDNLTRPKGRCGHVVFCDSIELHKQIVDAIVHVTKGAVPRNRIAQIVGATPKPKRLETSIQFNGREEIVVDEEVLQTAVDPAYDVVIGTSQAMAEGIDLQRRSCAVHHLNLSWEPATLHQRNGRAVRQGNLMGDVDVVYYLTEKTFDGIRFDKVARKAAWWDQMFSGAARTSNPAAAEDTEKDLGEIILEMFMEDPVELAKKLAEIKAARQARLITERIERASTDWINLNAAFERARMNQDPQRREALWAVAMRRRDAWRVAHRDFIVPGALEALNDSAVVIDWNTLIMYRAGEVMVDNRGEHNKILKVSARTRNFVLQLRTRGNMFERFEPSAWLANAKHGSSFSYEDERDMLVHSLQNQRHMFLMFASLAPDLWPHADDLFAQLMEQPGSEYGIQVAVRSSVLVMNDDRVVITYPFPPTGASDYFYPSQFLTWLRNNGVRHVFPSMHPEAWAWFVQGVRTDTLLAPAIVSSGWRAMLAEPTLVRQRQADLQKFCRASFGRSLGADVLKQRTVRTREDE